MSAVGQPQLSRIKLVGGLLLLALGHLGYIFLTYRARVLTHNAFWSSDLLVFAFPTLLVLAGYISLLHARRISWVLAAIAGSALAFLSCWISLFIAFSTFGT